MTTLKRAAEARGRVPRLERAAMRLTGRLRGKFVAAEDIIELLKSVIEPEDRVCVEGDNQKQADFLAEALAGVDPRRVFDLHMVQSVVALPDHVALFEKGIAKQIDFSFSGPQSSSQAWSARARSTSTRSIPTSSCSPDTSWISRRTWR